MEIKLKLAPQFESVFLINGRLSEGGVVSYLDNEVVYVTVLPLEAFMMSYTVKLVGAKIKSNEDLAACYDLGDGNFYLKLLSRYNYVYAVGDKSMDKEGEKRKAALGIVEQFFKAVTKGRINLARECLSEDLSRSIEDEDLSAFFDGYSDLVKSEKRSGEYYLIGKGGKSTLFYFDIDGGVIDNIVER